MWMVFIVDLLGLYEGWESDIKSKICEAVVDRDEK